MGAKPRQTAIDLSPYTAPSPYTVGADLSRTPPIDRPSVHIPYPYYFVKTHYQPSVDVEVTIKLPRIRRNKPVWEQQTAPLPAL